MTPEEKRPLGAVHVASVVVGAIIGVGIFFTPSSLARALPSPAWVLGVWLLGGVMSLAGALVFAELGARYPKAGGVYVFLREGFGPRAGPPLAFLYGWIQLLVIQPGSMAVVAIVLVNHVAYLTGPLPNLLRSAAAVAVLLVFTVANLVGLRTGGRIQVVMATLKVSALAIMIVFGAGWGSEHMLVSPRSVVPEGNAGSWLLLGLIPVLFSFGGAYHGTYVAGSVRDPEKAVPRGILGGLLVVLVLYLGVNVAYLALLGHDGLAASDSPAADAAALALGPLAGKALAVTIALSAAGLLNTVCLGFPFVIYAMARDKLFFQPAGRLSPRTGRPAVAVALQGLAACGAVLLGSSRVDLLLTGITFADAAFQAATAIALLRVRNQPAAVIRVPASASWVFFALAGGITVGCLLRTPRESAYGVVVLLIGIVVWLVWRREKTA